MASIQKYDELRNKTLPGLLLERAKSSPQGVAYRAKKMGIYHERTWAEFRDRVARCAMGLKALGLKKGDRLALMGDPCEEYVISELAAMSLGAITYGIYASSSREQLFRLMVDGGACIFVAENQEYTDLILPLADSLKKLRHVIIIDTKGFSDLEQSSLITFETLMNQGGQQKGGNPAAFAKLVDGVNPSDTAFIVYTPGTTGRPKSVMISHGKHLSAAYTLIDRYPILNESLHRTVVYLPLCNLMGKMAALTLPLLAQITPHYGESMEVLGETIFETAPTFLFTVPLYLKKFATGIFIGIEDSSPLKKLIYRASMNIGRRKIEHHSSGQKNPLVNILYRICRLITFSPILNKLGMNKLKMVLSTDSPLPPEVMAQWQIYGVNVSEFYSLTEAGGAAITAQAPYFPHPGNLGVPPEGWEVKLAEYGEILVRGQDIFEGYYNNPELTESVVDREGWFRTGDQGAWTAEGFLKLIDRKEYCDVSSNGDVFSPTRIEMILKSSFYIADAVLFKPDEKHITALIEVDFESISSWARLHDIPYAEYLSLVGHPEIRKLIGSELEKANRELAHHERVNDFRILPAPLSAGEDNAPLTPTRKARRALLSERYHDLVTSMDGERL